jgi:hypothetical protein
MFVMASAGFSVAQTEPAATQPAQTQPAQTTPAQTQPTQTQPAQTEPAQTEPTQTEPAPTDPAQTAPAQTEPAQTAPAQTEPAKSTSSSKGEVRVKVFPEEAYIFVNGKPWTHRTHTLKLAPGDYTITVANYGFAPHTEHVTIVPGQRKEINARLVPHGDRVSGPWGRIQIEGAPGGAAIFLNGTTPGFFVGHADEMNNNFVNVQELVVPPGKHQLFVVPAGAEQPLWSGPVDVRANERLIVYIKNHGKKADMVYKDWAGGAKTKSLRRFEAGTATARIAVAPVTAQLAADAPMIHCNQSGKLTWSSANIAATTLTAKDQTLADSPSGNLSVEPKQTTKYELRAAGPGGVVTKDVTINVDPTVQTSLAASTPDVRYVRVGDQVQEQGSSNLNWTAEHADSVRIDPIGPVSGTSGSQAVNPTPTTAAVGPVDEMLTYRITATNQCGGSDTSTASIHLTGSIAGPPPPAPVAEAKPPELPHTASPLPLLALLGVVLVTAGGVLLRLRSLGN